MEYKEDIENAKEVMKAYWDHEIIDHPAFSFTYRTNPGNFPFNMGDWTLGTEFDAFEKSVDNFEKGAENTFWGGEAIPTYFPNFGAGIVAAVLGINPVFEGGNPVFKSGTVWMVERMEIKEALEKLENVILNDNNEWFVRLKRCTEYAAKRGKDRYHVAVTDLGGILDILCSFTGPQKMIVALKRNPSVIDTCREIILEKTLQIYDELQRIIESYNHDGCDAWLGIWCPKTWYPIQCDISAMMSPKYFKRFVLPDLATQAEHMDYCFYHLDGPEQLIHLDDIISLPSITGIQWVPGIKPGMPQEWSDHWYPLYKKIQGKGKNLIIVTPPRYVSPLLSNLNHKGLLLSCFFYSEKSARCYAPSFMGKEYNGGEIIEKIIDVSEKNSKFEFTGEEFEGFLDENEIDIGGIDKNYLCIETNRRLLQLK